MQFYCLDIYRAIFSIRWTSPRTTISPIPYFNQIEQLSIKIWNFHWANMLKSITPSTMASKGQSLNHTTVVVSVIGRESLINYNRMITFTLDDLHLCMIILWYWCNDLIFLKTRSSKPCIRLCCPYGTIRTKAKRCQPNDAANTINVYAEQYHSADVQNVTPVRQFAFIHNYPCKRLRLINAEYIITAVCNLFPTKSKQTNHFFILTMWPTATERKNEKKSDPTQLNRIEFN